MQLLMTEDREKIFIRVTPELKQRWVAITKDRGIPQNLAGERLVEWIVKQTDEVQLAVFRMYLNRPGPQEEPVRNRVIEKRKKPSQQPQK